MSDKDIGQNDNDRGLIVVYTGTGKGKTTAAVGQSLRMAGHGFRVYLVHFMKGRDYGEFLPLHNLSNVTIVKGGRDEFVYRDNPDPQDVELAQKGLNDARKALFSEKYDLIVMDEINVALDFGLIETSDIVDMIKDKPFHTNIILTGRNAAAEIMEIADTITEMKELKHHYQSGVINRKGIEY